MSDPPPDPVPTGLPEDLLALLRRPSRCFVSTVGEDGTPYAASVWVDTDGQNILVATRAGEQEARNAARDARIALAVGDPDDPTRVYRVGGRVRDITAHGAVEQRRALARRYLDPVSADEPQGEQADALMLVVVPHRVARAA